METTTPFGSFPNHWEQLFRKSSLSDVTPHVLRHSFASIANDLGFTEVTIAALVGHAKGTVTSKYIHTLGTALIMAADTISGYIQGWHRTPCPKSALNADLYHRLRAPDVIQPTFSGLGIPSLGGDW
jgi:hypothetical protein